MSEKKSFNAQIAIDMLILIVCVCVCVSGEKMTDEEVDTLLSGVEDNQGQVNYEGK